MFFDDASDQEEIWQTSSLICVQFPVEVLDNVEPSKEIWRSEVLKERKYERLSGTTPNILD